MRGNEDFKSRYSGSSNNSLPQNITEIGEETWKKQFKQSIQQQNQLPEQKDKTFSIRARAQSQYDNFLQQPLPYTSNYYQDLTREKDVIRSAFEANNYTYIRDLPDQFMHKVILDNNRQRVEKARDQIQNPGNQPEKKVVKLVGGGYFEPFTYQDDIYDFGRQISKYERLKSLAKRLEVSEDEFKINDQAIKGKWEDPFKNNFATNKNKQQQQQQYIFPSYLPGDTYDLLAESKTRQRLINAARNIAGDFVPASSVQVLHKTTNLELGDIASELKNILETDWENSKFLIRVTSSDFIEVVFKLDPQSESDDPISISLYMNNLINDQRITPFGLSKAVAEWSRVNPQKNTLSFCFKPPWVKQTNVEDFYKLYPNLVPNSKKKQDQQQQ